MTSLEATALRRRRRTAERYKPAEIDLLLVAEAPPGALDRYFYFEDVREQDGLFRYVCGVEESASCSRSSATVASF